MSIPKSVFWGIVIGGVLGFIFPIYHNAHVSIWTGGFVFNTVGIFLCVWIGAFIGQLIGILYWKVT